jgi:prepilin-type N-terminal cleavage/methylation domain-containing protein
MGRRRSKGQSGFTLLEVMIAMAILATGLLAIATAQIWAINRTGRSRHQTEALHLAQQQLEIFHATPIASLPASGNDPTNPVDPDPNDGDRTTFTRSWLIQADTPLAGITTLTVTVSWVAKDGTVMSTAIQSMKAL